MMVEELKLKDEIFRCVCARMFILQYTSIEKYPTVKIFLYMLMRIIKLNFPHQNIHIKNFLNVILFCIIRKQKYFSYIIIC